MHWLGKAIRTLDCLWQRSWITISVIGLIGILGAGINGASFLNYGENFSSLLIAIGFLLAAVSYTLGFSLSH